MAKQRVTDAMMTHAKIQARRERARRNGLDKHPAFNNPDAFRYNPMDLVPKRSGFTEDDITDYEWMLGMPTVEHSGKA